ncbi:hypothetical protein GS481_01835 [Rhodococcus hoagii]|nr:hypothetical protein [Prescottella equi]
MDVDNVALWAGLLSGVVGVALAVVSIVFTRSVEQRSSDLNHEMSNALQRIESAVARSTADTSELIKVAWERLLPKDGSPNSATTSNALDPELAKAISSGVAAELRADLEGNGTSDQQMETLSRALTRLERSVREQIASAGRDSSDDPVDGLRRAISSLPPKAAALLSVMSENRHLTREEYRQLPARGLGPAMRSLRHRSLVGPLESADGEPVYWILPGIDQRALRAFLQMYAPASAVVDEVRAVLAAIGYLGSRHDEARR